MTISPSHTSADTGDLTTISLHSPNRTSPRPPNSTSPHPSVAAAKAAAVAASPRYSGASTSTSFRNNSSNSNNINHTVNNKRSHNNKWLKSFLVVRAALIVSVFLATFFPLSNEVRQGLYTLNLRHIHADETFLSALPSPWETPQQQAMDTAFFTNGRNSRFAYVFLIGGIHEDRPAWLGFLYNVFIATRILRQQGSVCDVWLMVQFAPDSQLHDQLPTEQQRLVNALGIRLRALEHQESTQSFSSIVYEKFRILEMTDYQRVMFLDSDIIPTANLDYLFYLTVSGTFRPNVIVATRGEPCNAGLFILEPTPTAYAMLQQIIRDQHESAKDLPYPKFDRGDGWGHNFEKSGDKWVAIKAAGRRWRYHASHSDQGLLFYWAKYFVKDVSIVIGDHVENWVTIQQARKMQPRMFGDRNKFPDTTLPVNVGSVQQRELQRNASARPLAFQHSCDRNPEGAFQCNIPYRDYAHFSGRDKPWQMNAKPRQYFWNAVDDDGHRNFLDKDTTQLVAPTRLWYQTIRELDHQFQMNIDVSTWDTMKVSPLGYKAEWMDLYRRIETFHNVTTTNVSTAETR